MKNLHFKGTIKRMKERQGLEENTKRKRNLIQRYIECLKLTDGLMISRKMVWWERGTWMPSCICGVRRQFAGVHSLRLEPRDEIQVISFGCKHLCPLSHQTAPPRQPSLNSVRAKRLAKEEARVETVLWRDAQRHVSGSLGISNSSDRQVTLL